ncbi:MAG: hypothetical protein QG661_826 [Actinomycetota bacterium]|jgi:hypothetical protein|nr:hypothetical protein [Actinomycetota bacterium]
MTEPDDGVRGEGAVAPAPYEQRRQRLRDLWQLHLPLAIVLVICASATIIEARRAGEGVWRAWAYMVEWPIIGLFAVWIWNRYRRHGSLTRGLADRWKAHVAQYSVDDRTDDPPAAPPPTASPDDAELDAWRDYVDELHRREPPGAPPAG